MKKLSLLALLAIFITLGLSQFSKADCVITGMNGTGNIINCPLPLQTTPLNTASAPANTTVNDDIVNIPNPSGVAISIAGVQAINTDSGADRVTVSGTISNDMFNALETGLFPDMVFVEDGANISALFRGISTSGQNDFVQVNGGMISGDPAIDTGGQDDTVEINGGTISSPAVLIFTTGIGNDTLRINGGTFISDQVSPTINTSIGEDNIILSGGTFNSAQILSDADNDTINVTTDISDLGQLNCGPGDSDTLMLSMDVPEELVSTLSADFIASGVTGSLQVNGIQYFWALCENRIPNFNGVVTTISLAPFMATNELLEDHTVTATVLTDGVPVEGILVSFVVTNGPNEGIAEGTDTTDSNGEATFTYASTQLGTDTIVAQFIEPGVGRVNSNSVSKTWILIRNVPTLSEWGLIAMAGILGIVGFMVIRRKKASA